MANCAINLCVFKKKVFLSWDQFQIPYPWSKGLYVWGDPIWVNPNETKKKLVERGLELEEILNNLTERAEKAIRENRPVEAFHQDCSE